MRYVEDSDRSVVKKNEEQKTLYARCEDRQNRRLFYGKKRRKLVDTLCYNCGAGAAYAAPIQALDVKGIEYMENPASDRTPTSVYRYFDAHGVLIYVGITKTGMQRNRQHNADKEWWKWVVTQEVDHFDDRDTAHQREVALISRHRPPFNRQHNPQYSDIRAAYLVAREIGLFEVIDSGPLPKALTKFPVDVVNMTNESADLKTRFEHTLAVKRLVFRERIPVKAQWGGDIGRVVAIEKHGPLAILRVKFRGGFTFKEAVVKLRMFDRKGRDKDYEVKEVWTYGTNKPEKVSAVPPD